MSKLLYRSGDLFAAPENTILVHACNTVGSWGGGIARDFRSRFPAHYKVYRTHCQSSDSDSLIGTCLLIRVPASRHDIACLFTSRAYGKRKDSRDEILQSTRLAVDDLIRQTRDLGKELHACRFNSGKFGVPWEETEAILNDLAVKMTIYNVDAQDTERTTGS